MNEFIKINYTESECTTTYICPFCKEPVTNITDLSTCYPAGCFYYHRDCKLKEFKIIDIERNIHKSKMGLLPRRC